MRPSRDHRAARPRCTAPPPPERVPASPVRVPPAVASAGGPPPRLGCRCADPSGLLDCIEGYFAAAPRPDARIEDAGPLDVPVGDPVWPYPARPRPGGGRVGADDVRAAAAVQRAAGLPVALEWICERSPELAGAARTAGLVVEDLPLLVADTPVELLPPPGVRLYLVGADDPDLARYQRVSETAFAHPGGPAEVGPDPHGSRLGAGALDVPGRGARTDGRGGDDGPGDGFAERLAVLGERIAPGRTVMTVAVERGAPVAVGSHQPVDVDGSKVSEVVGSPRCRGCGPAGSAPGWPRAGRARAADRRPGVPHRRRRRRRPRLRAGRLRPAGHHRRRRLSGLPAGSRRERASGGGREVLLLRRGLTARRSPPGWRGRGCGRTG